MVKVKEDLPYLQDGSIDVVTWLNHISEKGYSQGFDVIRNATMLAQLLGTNISTETGQSCLQRGLNMADVLSDLEACPDTIAAAIISPCVKDADLSIEDVEEQLGALVAKLVKGLMRMSAIQYVRKANQSKTQIDNIRRMLLAMVDDVRVVLIKLAERLCVLRHCTHLSKELTHRYASEAMDIYAPLANRLGIGAIKWELEDLGFRYLQPEDYKSIAKGLNSKRLERDKYVNFVVDELNHEIQRMGIADFNVYGRSKHIHSIYRKMHRKNIPLNEIYDATAVRVLVNDEVQCYEVLDLVHRLWQAVVSEFDDYIANPKPNGYRSLHTAVVGPEGRIFEVQIRTYKMHELAEMGVAAHWKYKEGARHHKLSHERKIEWLREVLSWHKEMALHKTTEPQPLDKPFMDDRVYVFTPGGDVMDLPLGVTPLDFAYLLHSEIGHRCRGAKVNDQIVPLTYALKMGDKVEILTGKEQKPSRDWLNPHLHYLTTARAKAKVLHWFKMQDYDKNKADGEEILQKELKTLGLKVEKLSTILSHFGYKKTDDLFAAVGRGEVKLNQILGRLSQTFSENLPKMRVMQNEPFAKIGHHDLHVEGVGHLVTHMAKCCQPIPGMPVVGYITLGRGVSIHRQDCANILSANERQKKRFLQVNWQSQTQEHYIVDLEVQAFHRATLLKDITTLLSNEKANVYAINSTLDKANNIMKIKMTIEVDNLNSLSKILNRLAQVQNVFEAKRVLT